MNLIRIGLAAVAAFAAYFVVGGLTFTVASFRQEFLRYPEVYRTQQGQMRYMPGGMVAMLLAMVVLAVLYAKLCHDGWGLAKGAEFGALIGVFFVCTFVVHNFVNLNIGLKLTMQQTVAYFVEWTLVGAVIGLVYRPVVP